MFQYSVNGTLDLISRQVLQVEQQPRDDDEDRPNRVTVSLHKPCHVSSRPADHEIAYFHVRGLFRERISVREGADVGE